MLRTVITFNEDWLLTRLGDAVSPPEVVKKYIMDNYAVKKVLKSDIAILSLVVDDEDFDPQSLNAEIAAIFLETYKDDNSHGPLFTLEASDYIEGSAPGVPIAETEEEKKTINIINELVGADEFKALANEIVMAAEGIKKNQLRSIFEKRAYLISIDSGGGISRYLELFADLVDELNLFHPSPRDKVIETKLQAPESREEAAAFTSNIFKTLNQDRQSHIFCIDISGWLGKLSDPNFRAMLDIVRNHESAIFFFRIPFVEAGVLKDAELEINDILNIKSLSISPFDSDQIRLLADHMITENGFTLEPEAWDTFDTCIAIEKNDGRFYGINTIRKVVYELLYQKQLSNAEHSTDNNVISKTDIELISDGILPDERPGLEQLNELIGMDELKKQILDIVAQIEYAHRDSSVKPPCIHMRFVGNPGTGKTTIARILGRILKEKGILRNGNFFEVFSRDLCGRYIGETAPKTAAKCRDAYGSVLFIDEAYALYNESERDFGREAIDTLITQMENHRSDLVVIMAGYPDKMDRLMQLNQGLRSRMPYLITFPNYTREQLADIFFKMACKSKYDEAFETTVKDYFNNLTDEFLNSNDFSNARFVRNLYERTWGKAILRCQFDGGDPNTLTAEDFTAASSDKEFVKTPERKRRRVGF